MTNTRHIHLTTDRTIAVDPVTGQAPSTPSSIRELVDRVKVERDFDEVLAGEKKISNMMLVQAAGVVDWLLRGEAVDLSKPAQTLSEVDLTLAIADAFSVLTEYEREIVEGL